MEQVEPRVDEINDVQHLEHVELDREVERVHYLFNTPVEPQTEQTERRGNYACRVELPVEAFAVGGEESQVEEEAKNGPPVESHRDSEVMFRNLKSSMQMLRASINAVATKPTRRHLDSSLTTSQRDALLKIMKSHQEQKRGVPWTELTKRRLFAKFTPTMLRNLGEQLRKRKAPEDPSLPTDAFLHQLQQNVIQLEHSCDAEMRTLRVQSEGQRQLTRELSQRANELNQRANEEIGMLREDCDGQWQRFLHLKSEKECLNRHDRCQERVKQLEAENETLRKKVCDVKVELNPYVAADSRSEYENWELNKLRDENQQLSGLIEEHEEECRQRCAYEKERSEYWERFARHNDDIWKRDYESHMKRKNDEIDELSYQNKKLEDQCEHRWQLIEALDRCTVVESRIIECANRLSGTKQLLLVRNILIRAYCRRSY